MNLLKKRNNCDECINCMFMRGKEIEDGSNLKYDKTTCLWICNESTEEVSLFCEKFNTHIPGKLTNRLYCDFMKKQGLFVDKDGFKICDEEEAKT